MKRNLFAIFLAVMLVAALVIVATPNAKATNELITAQADGEAITVSAEGTILDLNGKKNIVVTIENNVELSVIDTSFIVDEDTLDLTGNNAGTLTVDAASTGTIAPVVLHGDFRYLAVETEGTYSFHPFNLAISKLGINTISQTVCIRVTFIANDVVKAKLTDYGIKGVSGDATTFSAKENYAFGSKNGIQAYFDLTGSFDAEKLDVTCNYQAYMVIGGVDVLSNYVVEVTPRTVLKTINDGSLTPTDTQKAAIETIAAENAHLADLFTSITGAECTHNAKIGATCQKASVCKNCDATVGTVAAHKDDNTDNKCDWCGKPRYVEHDASELVVYKSKDKDKNEVENYDRKNITIYNRTNVYGVTFPASSWNFELAAKTTIPKTLYADSAFADWTAVRNNYKAQEYQYIAIDFALSAGAQIRAVGCFVKADNSKITTGGPIFTVGQKISWSTDCVTEDQRAYFTIYSNGKEITDNDTINAGQWYTVVIKLLTDVTGYSANSYSSAAFALGNGKEVYFSNVRYYTGDTYKNDYIFELPDYDEVGVQEIVVWKPTENDYSNQGTVFGRDNVYGATFNGWNVEAVAKNTANDEKKPAGSGFTSWDAVRADLIAKGYEYIAIDFALEKGASIYVAGSVLPGETKYGTTYLSFADNKVLNWVKTDYTSAQKAHFVGVYCNGEEVTIGTDKIQAGQWYTVVVKLLTEVDTSGRYSNVGFECGYGKTYFSNVRYYRNDSFTTDYVG